MAAQIRRSLQYLYFLRFSIFVGVFPLLFAVADMKLTYSMTRGIFVPEHWQGYACVAFFLVCKAFVALISARTVVVNGLERFGAAPPRWMKVLLANDDARYETWPVVITLIPATFLGVYLMAVGVAEGVLLSVIIRGLACGIVAAFLFSYGINAWYYLAYECPEECRGLDELELGKNAARTILFPRWAFGLKRPRQKFPLPDWHTTLEDIDTYLRGSWFAKLSIKLWTQSGRYLPGYSNRGYVYEAQVFSFIATIAFSVMFWILYPLTAPVPNSGIRISFVVLAVSLIGVWAVFLSGRGGRPAVLRRWQLVLCTLSAAFCLAIPLIYSVSGGQRFPTLASVLLLVIVVGWLLSGLAFFLDRYRIPVLTLFLVLIFVPRILSSSYGENEEHYVSTVPMQDGGEAAIPTPAQVLAERIEAEPQSPADQRPFVIVTATGGGLHAGAWMARLLEQIDRSFREYDRQKGSHEAESFRNHILLMSTVSGGSVGLSYYLRELDRTTQQDPPNFKRMVVAAQCSSLEAVGWGLVYYDLRKALAPRLLSPAPSPGDNDLESSPLGKDRTWALRKGLERNIFDAYCNETAGADEQRATSQPLGGTGSPTTWRERLWPNDQGTPWPQQTLFGLKATSGGAGPAMPAFTMNTTSAEKGARVLLANYRVPDYRIGPVEGAPAESFLDILATGEKPDLPLASAAQLSATFPLVSSAARIPFRYGDHKSEHFIDGGYYDNDGTASVIEFLRFALDVPNNNDGGKLVSELCASTNQTALSQKDQDLCQAKRLSDKLATFPSGEASCRTTEPPGECGKVRIILIEIRNSKDYDSPRDNAFPRAVTWAGSDHPLDLLSQLKDPLSGFWEAGHESVTGRDRNGLDLEIEALKSRLDIHHIILDDKTETPPYWIEPADNPLSWSLTPRERRQLREASDAWNGLGPCYANVVDAFRDFKAAVKENPLPARCTGEAPGSNQERAAWAQFIQKHASWDLSKMQPKSARR